MDPTAVIASILKFASSASGPLKKRFSRSERVIKALKDVGLDPEHPPREFSGIYAHALVEYAMVKEGNDRPQSALEIFRVDAVKGSFRTAYESGDTRDLVRSTTEAVNEAKESGDLPDPLPFEVEEEMRCFKKAFDAVVDRSRRPAEARIERRIADMQSRVMDVQVAIKGKLQPDDKKHLLEVETGEIQIDENQKGATYRTLEPTVTDCKTSLARLPSTDSNLFGRKSRLADLDEAWRDTGIDVVTLVAPGGVGKSALVNEWLNQMRKDNFKGAKLAYGWSFHSQGTSHTRQTSADEFMADALGWFGDPDPTEGSHRDKGRRLAGLVREQRTILILDGLEPLQYPPGDMGGWLKDRNINMQALLKELSHSHPGLCIITTRTQIEDLSQSVNASVQRIELEKLSPDAGAKLLASLGVKGSSQELRKASRDFSGNALALTLLGSYLATVHDGDVRRRDLIPELTEEQSKGGHARRVMRSYEQWMGGKPELNVLYLMSLFEQPIKKEVIEMLTQSPLIAGLTSELQHLSEVQWQYTFQNLYDLRLLSRISGDKTASSTIVDCHPLIREYFAERLRHQKPQAWQEAHERLYEYYAGIPKEEHPESLRELEPLYNSVAHACQAGRHQEALKSIYVERIRRNNEAYSVRKLGAFGADVAMLANFFETPSWDRPTTQVDEKYQALLLNWVGFRLRALGRIPEAISPLQIALKSHKGRKNWEEATKDAINLCEFTLIMGDVKQSIDYGQIGIDLFDKIDTTQDIEKPFLHTALLGVTANAYLQAGQLNAALRLFKKAEGIHANSNHNSPFLKYLAGFFYCDLLLEQGELEEAIKRANKAMEWDQGRLLDKALHRLSLGRAFSLQTRQGKTGYSNKARKYLDQSVEKLRASGYQDYLPRGLLSRAAHHRAMESYSLVREDLEEVWDIAQRGDMKLFLADYHIEAAHNSLSQGKEIDAAESLREAEDCVRRTGYLRRLPEIEATKRAL